MRMLTKDERDKRNLGGLWAAQRDVARLERAVLEKEKALRHQVAVLEQDEAALLDAESRVRMFRNFLSYD